jgi:ElaB/YqjD/DUF883 family membrane-anchored ribosome-binding protein
MAKSKDDVNEVTRLQQEAEKLRTRPRKPAPAAEPRPKTKNTQPTHTGEDGSSSDFQIEKVLQQLEGIVRERPALAVLTAFSVGIFVGRLFARK